MATTPTINGKSIRQFGLQPSVQPPESITNRLPDTLIQRALSYCDTNTLLSTRLCCRRWGHTPTIEHLFRSITLVPHLYLLQDFILTFSRSPLTWVMTSVMIDASWISWLTRSERDKLGEPDPRRRSDGDGLEADVHEQRWEWLHSRNLDGLAELQRPNNSESGYYVQSFDNVRYGTLDSLSKMHISRPPVLHSLLYDRMSCILKMLPSLQSVNINFNTEPKHGGYWGRYCEPGIHFHEFRYEFSTPPCLQRIRLQSTSIESVSWSVLTTLTEHCPLSLHTLRLGHFNAPQTFQDCPSMAVNHLKPLLEQLTELEIHLARWPSRPQERSHANAHRLSTALAPLILAAAPNLHALRLICDNELTCQRSSYIHSPPVLPRLRAPPPLPWSSKLHTDTSSSISSSITMPSFPHLRHLWLQNITCTPTSLLHFTATECPSLQSLVLINIHLSYRSGNTLSKHLVHVTTGVTIPTTLPTPCWVHLLKTLRTSAPSLVEIDFGGFLTNGARQHWHIDPALSAPSYDMHDFFFHPSLKQRIRTWFHCKYISDDLCPLNVFAVPEGILSLGAGGGDVSLLARVSDESWAWMGWPGGCPFGGDDGALDWEDGADDAVPVGEEVSDDSEDETVC